MTIELAGSALDLLTGSGRDGMEPVHRVPLGSRLQQAREPSFPMKYLLIRHGQTAWNLQRRWQGHTDIPLNDTGIDQAKALANRLVNWNVDAIYSSDLRRASMTAAILAERLDLPYRLDAAWRERDVGGFAGLTTNEVQERYPAKWAEMLDGVVNPPGGEATMALYDRVTSAFDSLLANHDRGIVAIVSHGGALMSIVSYVLGLDPAIRGRFSIAGNTGLSVVERNERGMWLSLLNDTSHLE